jgi:hypothetical protein
VGKGMEEADEDVRQQVGVVEGFEGVWAMDTTLEMICERWARSPDMAGILDDAEVEASLGR